MYTLGLHLDKDILKIALIESEKKQAEIRLLRSFSLQELENVKLFDILKPILAAKPWEVVSGLEAWDLCIRELQLKLSTKKAVLEALPFQAEPLLPYPLEEAIIFPRWNKKIPGDFQLTFFATRQSCLKSHLETLQLIDIDPEWVSCTPQALERFIKFFFPLENSIFIYHLGRSKGTFVSVMDQSLSVSHTHSLGMEDVWNALSQDLPEKTQQEIQELAKDLNPEFASIYPNFSALLSQWEKDLERIAIYFKQKNKNISLNSVLLLGEICYESPLFYFLNKHLETLLNASMLTTEEKSFVSSQAYAIPLGLGLEKVYEDPFAIQFRQKEFTHPKIAKKQKKQISYYLLSCFILTLLSVLSFSIISQKKEAVLLKHLISYYSLTMPQEPQLYTKNLEEALSLWQKNLTQSKASFTFDFPLPKVTHVLNWLAAHPQLNPTEEDSIELKNFHYELIKYPKLGEKKEPYQAKIELEFTTAAPHLAREFHEALKKGDAFINTKQSIDWKVNQNTYFCSFFLNVQTEEAAP